MQTRLYSGTWIKARSTFICEGTPNGSGLPRGHRDIVPGDLFLKHPGEIIEGAPVWSRHCAACGLAIVERARNGER